ncbi:HET-domain-containing protein, partial [Amniculicola lignicola CBS 123094]
SYCWGNPALNLTTTTETLGERQRGIDWSDVPRTIKDAIIITRLMKIRYLWVDALCIVQDDLPDWQEEAADMALVYENATVVISATRAASANDGFIRSCDPSTDRRTYDPNSCHPLLLRGWTLQERLLARRTMHFLNQELVWECRGHFWCECSENNRRHFNAVLKESKVNDRVLVSMWQSIVVDCSHRRLTKVEDTLPALSGVVTKLKSFGMGNFRDGLWEKNLVYFLLWYSEIHREPTNPRRSIGPTWSW